MKGAFFAVFEQELQNSTMFDGLFYWLVQIFSNQKIKENNP